MSDTEEFLRSRPDLHEAFLRWRARPVLDVHYLEFSKDPEFPLERRSMMKRMLRKMSGKGDEVVAEWETETVLPEKLKEIGDEFKAAMESGYFAANVDTDELIREFDPAANILLIPRMQGG